MVQEILCDGLRATKQYYRRTCTRKITLVIIICSFKMLFNVGIAEMLLLQSKQANVNHEGELLLLQAFSMILYKHVFLYMEYTKDIKHYEGQIYLPLGPFFGGGLSCSGAQREGGKRPHVSSPCRTYFLATYTLQNIESSYL